jgi:hypothetical protein
MGWPSETKVNIPYSCYPHNKQTFFELLVSVCECRYSSNPLSVWQHKPVVILIILYQFGKERKQNPQRPHHTRFHLGTHVTHMHSERTSIPMDSQHENNPVKRQQRSNNQESSCSCETCTALEKVW